MDNNYVIVKGFKFKSNKNNIYDLLKNLFGSNQAICALDSNGAIHISEENEIYLEPNEKSLNFCECIDSLKFINKEKKFYLKKFYNDFSNEESLIDDNKYRIRIKLRDFDIKLIDFKNKFKVNIELTAYENNMFIFTFNIKIPNKIDYINFEHSLLYNQLDYIQMPYQYLDFSKIEDIPDKKEKFLIVTSHYFNNFISDFVNIINNNGKVFVEEQRSSIFINKTNISKQDIFKLLYQSNIDVKEDKELKDYRLANDYKHYSNQILSVLIGENVSSEIWWIILLDTIIIQDLLNDCTYLNNIYDNNYSLKELLQIQEEYERKTSFKKHFPLVEGNDYINSIFNLLNKYDVNTAISNAIERKKEDKHNKKELLISIIGCILAVPALYDYIIEPLILWIYNSKHKANIILKLPNSYKFIVVITLLILSLILFFTLSYIIDNKKSKN